MDTPSMEHLDECMLVGRLENLYKEWRDDPNRHAPVPLPTTPATERLPAFKVPPPVTKRTVLTVHQKVLF